MGRKIYSLLLVLALAGAGCGDKGGSIGSPATGGTNYNPSNPGGVPPITDPDPGLDPDTGGATVALSITSKTALDQFTGWTTNLPTETKVVVTLNKYATFSKSTGGYDYGFGGYVSVKFKDGSNSYTDTFSSKWLGDGNCGIYGDCNTVDNNTQNHKYNLLTTDYPEMRGNVGYHGFFEDTRVPRLVPPTPYQPLFGGAVILVIDSTNDSGDGQGPTSANGSIWFKNYVGNYPMGPLPYTNCWFISSGPYDCRAWKSNGKVNTKASIYPDNGYVKLGSFINLDIKKAFNDQI
jgi:hypothetical protein